MTIICGVWKIEDERLVYDFKLKFKLHVLYCPINKIAFLNREKLISSTVVVHVLEKKLYSIGLFY
jgi:hypothetical protein